MLNNSRATEPGVSILAMKAHVSPESPSEAVGSAVSLKHAISRPRYAAAVDRVAATPDLQIRILIADDHPVVCHGLRALLSTQHDFSVIGEAHNGIDALRFATDLKPDVMLLDLSMPGLSGIEVMRKLSGSKHPVPCQTILLTAAVDKSDIVRLLRMGMRGVVRKDESPELLFKSIRKVHEGELWVGRDTLADIVDALTSPTDSEPVVARPNLRLTPREQEILELLVQGEANKRIARRLSVSEDTVKHHITSIFDKGGVSNRLELVLFAIHHRLVQSPPL